MNDGRNPEPSADSDPSGGEPRWRSPRACAGARRRSWASWLATATLASVFTLDLSSTATAQPASPMPPSGNPEAHAFPALGLPAERKVNVEWNRFYDHAGLGAILEKLHRAYPDLTRLYSIGKSVQGRDLWCLEVTAFKVGDAERKPGMYIDGNIHGNEVQAGEVVAYTAWYLCQQYGRLEKITALLDHRVLYLIPTINPDGRDRWFHEAQTQHSSRTGAKPVDDDGDGVADEDDTDDLDGDGSIVQMRIRDPNGRWKPHPQFPDYAMVEVPRDEKGEYTLLGWEGLDNDGDGRVNEDPLGGYDMNRNWAWDWQPNYIQHGAMEYPFSLPETRALSEFILNHPNIAAAQSYHNAGGMILRSPGREGGAIHGGDEAVAQFIASRGEKILPFYRSMIIWKDLYTVWGGEIDWLYAARGAITYTTELWSTRNLNRRTDGGSREDETAFLRDVLLNDGAVKWHQFDHPTYGKIELGGTKKNWGRTPPSFLLEEECHRNMAFTVFHADQMPLLKLDAVKAEKLDNRLYRLTVTVLNERTIPTRLEQDVQNHISSPDTVTLTGADVKVLTSGIVTDRYFNRVTPTKRRPERVELSTIPGMQAVRTQFIVSGQGKFRITVDSAHGGVLSREEALP